MEALIKIDYVNERQDRRPASLKGNDGKYYTLSDPAYTMLLPWKGHEGTIGFYTNDKGFHTATHWNGQELPKGQAGTAVRAAAATPAPVAPPASTIAPPALSPPPDKPPYGFIDVDGVRVRTLPTVREQFVMRIAEKMVIDPDKYVSVEAMVTIMEIAKKAWAQTMETPADPSEPAHMGTPPQQGTGQMQVDRAPLPGYGDDPGPQSAEDYGLSPPDNPPQITP